MLQAAVYGPHPEDEASRGIDSYQQQALRSHSTGLLGRTEKGPLNIPNGTDPQVESASNLECCALSGQYRIGSKLRYNQRSLHAEILSLTCSAGGGGRCGRSFILSPRLRRPFFCLQIFRHSGQHGSSQPGMRCVLKHRMQKSWPQSSEMGSRSLSRQMEQVGGSRAGEGRCPRPSSNLGNDAWDLEGRTSSECGMPVGCRVWRSDSLGVKAPLRNLSFLGLPGDTFLISLHPRSWPCPVRAAGQRGEGTPESNPQQSWLYTCQPCNCG